MRLIRHIVLATLAGISILFLTVPIVMLAMQMLESGAWRTLNTGAVSDAVGRSFLSSFVTILITLLFGTPLAYVLARWQFRGRRFLNVVVELPIILPPAVAGLALLLTLGRRSAIGMVLEDAGVILPFSVAAVILAQLFVAAPFYIRAAIVGFQTVPQDVEEAARVDGADGFALFIWITVPLAARALGAGLILCWSRALGEFGATILFAGSLQGRTRTMPLLIYDILASDIDAAISTGVLLVGMALMALLLSRLVGQRSATGLAD